MVMRKAICFAVGALCVVLCSCEQTIYPDYPASEPKDVVEAYVSDDGMRVYLSRSMDVTDTVLVPIDSARVEVNGSDGSYVRLKLKKRGLYESEAKGVAGVRYTVKVSIGDAVYTACSMMPEAVGIDTCYFYNLEVVGQHVLLCAVKYRDRADAANYYYVRASVGRYHNKIVETDELQDGKEMTTMFSCETEESGDEDANSLVVKSGDVMEIELRSIGKEVYDYFRLAGRSSTSSAANPKTNFEGGCLGIFCTYSVRRYTVRYE